MKVEELGYYSTATLSIMAAVGGRGEEEWGRYRPWGNNINRIT